MIKITNGSRTVVVTKGAFKNWYEPMGWKEVEPGVVEEVTEPEEEELGEEAVEETEIPLSELNLEGLKAYADEMGIDISQAKTKKEIRNLIRAEMEG